MTDCKLFSKKFPPSSIDIIVLTGHMAAELQTVFLSSLAAKCGMDKHFVVGI